MTEAWTTKLTPSPRGEFEMDRCPFCLLKPAPEKTCWAIVSPWIRELGATKRRVCRYLICDECELGWFSLRYSAEGLENLYKKYRGESYTAVRNKWESWYDGKYNESHQNTDWINSRAKAISTFLKGKVDLSVSEVVDIGGDTGQIAELLGAKSFRVVEISDRAVSSKTQSRHLPSVAVLAHVLEHVSSPKEFLASLLKNHNSVYVEVPNGIPSITPERRSTARLVLGLLASLSPHTWRPFARPSAGRRHPAQLLRVSEHLTFFNEVSFQNLPAGDIEGSLLVSSISAEIPSPDRTDPVKVLQALWKSNM